LNSIVLAITGGAIWLNQIFADLKNQSVDRSPWKVGLGEATTMVAGGWAKAFGGNSATRQFFASVIVANLPQVVLSYLYLLYNGLLTSLLVAAEWSSYSVGRKGLRVSEKRHGYQRSGFLLSIPLRYGLSLSCMCSLLQWLLSQSMFLVKTVGIASDGQVDHHFDASRIGFSPLGCIISISVGGAMILAMIPLALKK
jgi:hypothetical protein